MLERRIHTRWVMKFWLSSISMYFIVSLCSCSQTLLLDMPLVYRSTEDGLVFKNASAVWFHTETNSSGPSEENDVSISSFMMYFLKNLLHNFTHIFLIDVSSLFYGRTKWKQSMSARSRYWFTHLQEKNKNKNDQQYFLYFFVMGF